MITPPQADAPTAAPTGPARRRRGRWAWALALGVVAVVAVLVVVLTNGGTPGSSGNPAESGSAVGPVHPPGDVVKPVGGPSGVAWKVQFDENFGGDTASVLDSGVWHAGWFGNGKVTGPVNSQETSLFSVDNLSVSGGVARFDVTPNSDHLALGDGTTQPNLGAALNTDESQASRGFAITYGYVEARMQMPAGDRTEGVWPAFWLNGQTWPDDMEIDVVEGDGTDQGNKFNIHHGSNDHDTTNLNDVGRRRTVPGATTGMHTYAADIRPDGITYFYDGAPVYSYQGKVPNSPRYLMVGASSEGTMTSTKSLLVDYVRAWTRAGS
ncbi:MAG TPA: family 16 glycosylhydrolase [Blastococcus sp.]|nr:family 16 glycosylhydrolase [Blastococcus sp.]